MSAFPLDHLPSIGLTDLNGGASLLTRRDRKYLVPESIAGLLIEASDGRVLEINGRRSFRYESVYFDTPDLISYRAAAHRRRRRFKVRTRSYLDSGLCSLEVKTRRRRGLTEKHRLPYQVERRSCLNREARAFIDRFDTIAPVGHLLAPTLTTRYRRVTLLEPHSMSRITIDTGLEMETMDGSTVALPGTAVVETKTAGPPCPADHFLWSCPHRPLKLSKYGTGLAALTPGLPANKWNRVLRGHFGWTPRPTNRELLGRQPGAHGAVAPTNPHPPAPHGPDPRSPLHTNEGNRT